MKIISWNINGLRAVIRHGFIDFLKKEKPDILCLQEIKIAEEARKKELGEVLSPKKTGYEIFWNSAKRPGYSGTAILAREKFNGLAFIKETKPLQFNFDDEGRAQTIELDKFFLVNAYFPNSSHELSRLDYKLRFNRDIFKYVKKLESKKPVIICGDFNVAHEEIDLARPKDNIGNPGFTNEERAWMGNFLGAGFIDTFRFFHKDKIQYSWWSYRFNARSKNIGWRIDYFCVSTKIIKEIKTPFILDKISGSDHCPVGIKL